jgi:hypothetical protein
MVESTPMLFTAQMDGAVKTPLRAGGTNQDHASGVSTTDMGSFTRFAAFSGCR